MFRKNHLTIFLTFVLFSIGGIAVFAQNSPVGGRVELKTEDGKVTPVQGALVEVYRIDQKTKHTPATTDKKGNFSFAGLPLGGTYALSISAPGISPEIQPGVKPGMTDLVIDAKPGDGKKWTEEEVRLAISDRSKPQQSAELTADQKKLKEEDDKKRAEIMAKNEKAVKSNEILNATSKEGKAALDAGNYDLAIAKFEEGYNAEPTYVGSAPVMLNGKAAALNKRAITKYNATLKADEATKKAAREAGKTDFNEAVIASDKSIEILKTATTTDPNIQKNYAGNKSDALVNRKEAYRLMAVTGADREKGKEALAAFQEYIAAEPDAEKKSKAELELALTLQESNEFELAITEFQKILETSPDNVDALAGIGLSMVNVGYINLDTDPAKGKAQLQEAANYLQKFVDAAPDTHKYKEDAKKAIITLKDDQKLVPQKVKTTTTKKKN